MLNCAGTFRCYIACNLLLGLVCIVVHLFSVSLVAQGPKVYLVTP